MTKEEYEKQLQAAGQIQRENGWSEESIQSYADEHRDLTGDYYSCVLLVGAGLAQDNSRHGVTT